MGRLLAGRQFRGRLFAGLLFGGTAAAGPSDSEVFGDMTVAPRVLGAFAVTPVVRRGPNMDSVIGIDSDNDVTFLRVRRKNYATGEYTYLNGGTCSWSLKKKVGTVYEEIDSGDLTYLDDDLGGYAGVIPSTVASAANLDPGRVYYIDLVFSDGDSDATRRQAKKARFLT